MAELLYRLTLRIKFQKIYEFVIYNLRKLYVIYNLRI